MLFTRAKPALEAAIVLMALCAPAAFAYTGGHGGGGGHAGGGAHFSGGGHAAGGGHAVSGGAHFSAGAHVNGGAQIARAAPSNAHTYNAARPAAYIGAGRSEPAARGPALGRTIGAGGLRSRPFGPGYGHPAHWGGGYWGGRFWPAAYYGPGFAWFLPTIPLYCATYWWSGVPYYYYNDIYYTWSPAADGYVATDPPPADPAPSSDGSYPSGASSEAAPPAAPEADGTAPGDASVEHSVAPDPIPPGQFAVGRSGNGNAYGNGGDHVFAYPANGQSEQQQAQDRAACDQWATAQARGANSGDFRRAVIACFQGRGYSAQ